MYWDFAIKTYNSILEALSNQGFSFQSFIEFLEAPDKKSIVLRHDVDLLPLYSSAIAKLEAERGIKGTYYFRIVPESFDEKIIKEIYSLGHEVGYHYEDLSFAMAKLKAQGAGRKAQGAELENLLVEIGIESFKKNLEDLRKIVPVETICMHGSPMSRWDSRLLWKYYDYHDFGIVGEPYFDINFEEVLYLTDTGRCWDGDLYNIRDKAVGARSKIQTTKGSSGQKVKDPDNQRFVWADGRNVKSSLQPSAISHQPSSPLNHHPVTPSHRRTIEPLHHFHSTFDIIYAAEAGKLPDKIMLTFHPQRWTDKPIPWMKELIWQNTKNVAKYFLIKLRK